MNEKIDYGDAVEIEGDAPTKYHPGEGGSTCGYRIIESEKESNVTEEAIGTALWLIELPNGDAFEIPEKYLKIMQKGDNDKP